MKITKYPQSHLVIEKDGKKLVIDPGYPTFEKGFKVEDFQNADAYLITHIHRDHMDSKNIASVIGDKPVYGNNDVAAAFHLIDVKADINIVEDREKFSIAGFEIQAFDLSHFPLPLPTGPKPGPHNTGFLIDGIFFNPGDGIKLDGLNVENAAIPVAHPAITLEDSLKFAQSLNAKVVIPIHQDVYQADEEKFKQMGKEVGIEVRVLKHGEETKI